ncbi:MAG: polysaccharide lyase family 8 super-sandwich domain-containing protein, partial [Bacteroidota bacterium]
VCLGSGIGSTSGFEINTTVNQCLFDGQVLVSQSGSVGSLTAKDEYDYLNDLDWVLHNNVGYFFPQGGVLKLSNETQTGSWNSINGTQSNDPVSGDVFKLWFPHGNNPSGSSYSYIIAPGLSSQQDMQNYSLSNIEILENSTNTQAVMHHGLDMIQIVFYSPATITYGNYAIGASQPCTLILKNVSTSNVLLSIADPGENHSQIDVTWNSPEFAQAQVITCNLPTGSAYAGDTVNYTIGGSQALRASIGKENREEDLQELNSISIYPNPIRSGQKIEVGINSDYDQKAKFFITGIDGSSKIVNSKRLSVGMNHVHLPTNVLTPGIYVLQISHSSKVFTKKIIVR